MGNELAVRNDMGLSELGGVLAQSGYFKDAEDAGQAIVKVLAGQELGFGPIAAMTGIYIVKGRVTLSANLIAAAIQRSGRYRYRIAKMSDTECRLLFFDGSEQIGESIFTIEDAKRAGLLASPIWRQYPRNMLFARAMSNGAKWFTPDVFGGPIYTPDELGAAVDGDTGEIVQGEFTRVTPGTLETESGDPEPTSGPEPTEPEPDGNGGDPTTPSVALLRRWNALVEKADLLGVPLDPLPNAITHDQLVQRGMALRAQIDAAEAAMDTAMGVTAEEYVE